MLSRQGVGQRAVAGCVSLFGGISKREAAHGRILSDEWFNKVNEPYKTAGALKMMEAMTSVTVNLAVKTRCP
jgi:hypothetical protein